MSASDKSGVSGPAAGGDGGGTGVATLHHEDQTQAKPLSAADQPVRLYAITPEKFRARFDPAPPKLDRKLILDALDFATAAHANQKRESGEPYITHPVAVG